MSTLHDVPLVSTIAIGLSVAFVCGFIATKLRLSPLVGYLLAGILVGPYTPGLDADPATAEQLSEIGVVLLLFGVGLHFSIQDFMEVRKIASFGAITRIAIITGLGAVLGTFWGWSLGTGLLFGLALSVASTVVLLRALEEHHLMQTVTGKISIGWLVVEDVAMVLAMVMVPALAAGGLNNSDGGSSLTTTLAIAFGKVGLFAVIMVVVGKRVLPWLLTAVSRTGSRELFTLAAISMAMGIAFGAAILFGVSLALGAFFAGMMIRESDLNHEVADRVLPLQDAFAVLFFVSVGMLFNPAILVDKPLDVLATVLIIVVVKAVVTFTIMMAFRYPVKISLKISAGLAQIGEFSFILLTLGASVGLIDAEVRNLILAGALISIIINPFLFKAVRKWIACHEQMDVSENDKLAYLETGEAATLKNLIVLIGYGRTGHHIKDMIDENENDLVIVENNREVVEKLRKADFHAIAGDATEEGILIEAQVEKADAVMITVPDPFEARRVVELVQKLKPDARILVRSHNDEETTFFNTKNVSLAVDDTLEIARRMVQHLGLHTPA